MTEAMTIPPEEAEEAGQVPTLAEDPALGLSHRAKLEILGAILLGAVPRGAGPDHRRARRCRKIVTDLGGNDLYTWVVTIYLLTQHDHACRSTASCRTSTAAPLLMIGITLFLIGSALSGLSQEMWQLILFRGIQGLGAGALFPISLAVIGDLFTPAERGKYQGLFGAVFGISFIIGPALGGFLTDNVSWHWVFYVNIPIGLVSLYVIWRLLPTIKAQEREPQLRLPGRARLHRRHLVPADRAHEQAARPGPPGRTPRSAASSRSASSWAVVFLVIESRAKEPIVPLDLWREQHLRLVDGRDVPRQLRVLRRDHLPAALVPGGPRRQRDRVGLRDLPAAHRADRLVDRGRDPRRENRQVQDRW